MGVDGGVSEMAVASMVAAAASTAVGVASASASADAQEKASAYQAQVAKNNQQQANQAAVYAQQQGQVMEDAKREQTAQTLGGERAAMAANGVDLDSGSALRLQGDTAKVGELDALTIKNNAARASYGYQVQGLGYADQANMDMSAASNAETAGTLNEFSSLVGGASSVGSKWVTYQNNGVFA